MLGRPVSTVLVDKGLEHGEILSTIVTPFTIYSLSMP